jgi:transcriptional regulator with XRE-family HTH domain
MANYVSGELIKGLRKRKGLQQSYLQKISQNPSNLLVTLSRIENQRQQPTYETLSGFLDLLNMPMEQFFCPHLEGNISEVGVLRDRLLYCLDSCETDEAKREEANRLIGEISVLLDMDSILNRQFILNARSRLYEIMGDYMQALTLANEGLAIVYPEFDENDFDGELLMFEEADLLLTRTRVYLKTNRRTVAMCILETMYAGIIRASQISIDNERKIPRIALTLVHCLIEDGVFDKALEVASQGLSTSIHRNMGLHVPDFAYIKALCLYRIGNKDEATLHLKYACFAAVLLGMKEKVSEILNKTRTTIGITFDTYGAENIPSSLPVEFNVLTAYNAAADNIGIVIRKLREQTGLKPKDIYSGLCSKGNYSMLESGQYKTVNIFLLQSIFQRLGHDVGFYFNAFLSQDDMNDMQLTVEIQKSVAVENMEEAAKLRSALEKRKYAQTNHGKQFLKMIDGILSETNEVYTTESYAMFNEAIRFTIPGFDEKKISAYRLTTNELACIVQIMLYYRQTGQYEKGISLYNQTVANLRKNCVDNRRVRDFFVLILNNFANFYMYMERYGDALPLLREAEELAIRRGQFTELPRITYTIAQCLVHTRNAEEAKTYCAMAYYGSGLAGNKYIQDKALVTAKNDLDLDFM